MYSQSQCDPTTPSFFVDLTGNPSGIYISPNVSRKGLCCGLDPNASPPIRCVEFVFTLDSEAQGIRFDINSGAVPSGSLGYQINCGPYYQVGENICLSGVGPHRLTFCKPGSNANTYKITSIAKPRVTPPSVVSNSCSKTLTAYNFEPGTVNWTSIPYNATHNSYLSCTSCTETVINFMPNAPPYVDYEVSGVPSGGCSSTLTKVITRVYFVNDKSAFITPKNPTICFGGSTTTITANGTGGAPPYRYLWNTGETTQTIPVTAGKYWVTVMDSTSCPTATDTVIVTAYMSPITADAGPDVVSCVNNIPVKLTGAISQALGGVWSGNGSFLPSDTDLNATYYPTPAEVTAGTASLTLTTTGNGTCPEVTDQTQLTILKTPVVYAGPAISACKNNPAVILKGTIQHASGGTWSGGAGEFYPDAQTLNARYTPTQAEIDANSVVLTLTSTGNGSCLPVSANTTINFTNPPTVFAGNDQTICFNNPVISLSGTASGTAGIVWSGGGGMFSSSTNLVSTYQPTNQEMTSGLVKLKLTSTDNGNCLPVSDEISVIVTPSPVVNAGSDHLICTNRPIVNLQGLVTGAPGGSWSSPGSGIFSPNPGTLNATYKPSAAEIANGKFSLTLTSTGNGNCLPVSDVTEVTIIPGPIANAGADRILCSNNSNIALNGIITNASGGIWSLANGTFSPNNTTLNATYIPSSQDQANRIFAIILTTTGNGNCPAASDTFLTVINPAPVVNAGPDQTYCSNNSTISLSGNVLNGGVPLWAGGVGSFVPGPNTVTSTYNPLQQEIAAGAVTLRLTSNKSGCLPVSDEVKILFTPPPTVSAGADINVCINNPTIKLNGVVTIAGGGQWSLGNGIFKEGRDVLLNSYTLTNEELLSGNLILKLTTTSNGKCNPVSDELKVSVMPAPSVNAGIGTIVCANNALATLSGSVSLATGAIWTGGTGTYSPNSTSLSLKYLPSEAEKTAGFVKLTLVSTGNGLCLPVTDDTVIVINPSPIVNAGQDITVCANNPKAGLKGIIANATGGTWSGGNGLFTPHRNSLNAIYTPTAEEIILGKVGLTLTSTGNNNCISVFDNVDIIITPAPEADAGTDKSVCGTTNSISLKGTVSIATSGTWSSSGTGSFTVNSPEGVYVPSALDKTTGKVTLTLTSTGNGNCSMVKDELLISFTPISTIQAGPDQTVCTGNFPVQLSGSGSPAIWSGGKGVFTPDRNTLAAKYKPDITEINAGNVSLTLTTLINGACLPVMDEILITIPPGTLVDAGPDQTICADRNIINLTPQVINATNFSWTTSGKGLFTPNPGIQNPVYNFTKADKDLGYVHFTITAGNGICEPVKDTLRINIVPVITADAGLSQTICADLSELPLNGIVTGIDGGMWTSNGSGVFKPDNQKLNAIYVPSTQDKITGNVILTLTSNGNGICSAVKSNKNISITPAPGIYAGENITICADSSFIAIKGEVNIAKGGTWTTTGTGIFSPDANKLETSYYPSPEDLSKGNVTLTLKSTGNGSCKEVLSTKTISITPAPIADAGTDVEICSTKSEVSLTGKAMVATGGIWTTFGSGSFVSNAPSGIYKPSANDYKSGSVTLKFTTTGNGTCKPVSDNMVIKIIEQPIVDAGVDITRCATTNTISLNGISTSSSVAWTTSGSGTFVPNTNSLDASYTLSTIDKSRSNISFLLTTTNNGPCIPAVDERIVTLIQPSRINAGPDKTICSNKFPVDFNATGSPSVWSGGKGIFSPSPSSQNVLYSPTLEEIISGTFTITLTSNESPICAAVQDSVIISVIQAPKSDAGIDISVCADAPVVSLIGKIYNATGGQWRTSNGAGSFSEPDSLTTYFTPDQQQIASGMAIVNLLPTGSSCIASPDPLIITIAPIPVVNAGPDMKICADLPQIQLNGKVLNSTGGVWKTTGSGTFSPNTSVLNAIYTPSILDKSSGSVKLILSSTGNGKCNVVTDTMFVLIGPAPLIDAGPQTMCSDENGIELKGIVTNAGGIQWSTTGSGQFIHYASTLNTRYIPSALDIAAGQIKIRIKSINNGTCLPVSDSILVSVISKPNVSAGRDQVVCADLETISLSGAMSGAPGIMWGSTGGGAFSAPTNLNTTYTVSNADILNGRITFTLTTTGTGACKPMSSQLLAVITPAPTVNAGPDRVACKDFSSVQLYGNHTISNGIQWTSSGAGTFTPNAQTENPIYIPSPTDRNLSGLTFMLTTTGNGLCKPKTDESKMELSPTPTIYIGEDEDICTEINTIALSGDLTVASGISWTVSGTGIIGSTGPSTARYMPSLKDKQNGFVLIKAITTGNGTCLPVNDEITYKFIPSPTVDAGPISLCSDLIEIPITGSISYADGSYWTTTGSGIFEDSILLSTKYIPSAGDRLAGKVKLVLHAIVNGLCSSVTDTTEFHLMPSPSVDAGSSITACSDAPFITLNGSYGGTAIGGLWTTSGTGSFSDDNDMQASYFPSSEDTIKGEIILRLNTLGAGPCNPIEDTLLLVLTKKPWVDAGPETICTDSPPVKLIGKIGVAGGAKWSSSGTGTFAEPDNLITEYTPSLADKGLGYIIITLKTVENGTCTPEEDIIILNITPAPTVNAGDNQVICANTTSINLAGQVSIATGGEWHSTGSGTFNNGSSLVDTYFISPEDTIQKVISLILTSTGQGQCMPLRDTLTLTINPLPVVNTLPGMSVCKDASLIEVSGTVFNTSSIFWESSGSGSFSGNTPITEYIPSEADTAAGAVTLTLKGNGLSGCPGTSNQVLLSLTPTPTIYAGPEIICSDNTFVDIFANITVAKGVRWTTTGTGLFVPNQTSLNAIYIPSAEDRLTGNVDFVVTTTDNGTCKPVIQNLELAITPPPAAETGMNRIICADVPSVGIEGKVTAALGVEWTTSGSGVFDPGNTEVTKYIPSAIDKANGFVKLAITTTGTGKCYPDSDTLLLIITPAPEIQTGNDLQICPEKGFIDIKSEVRVATGIFWKSSGTGFFSPDAYSPESQYFISEQDIQNNVPVQISVSSTGNGTCIPVNDSLVLSIFPSPKVDAGLPNTVCADINSIGLNGQVEHSQGGVWSSSGTGTFSPSSESLVANYLLSDDDKIGGRVVFSLTSKQINSCDTKTSLTIINITPTPTISAGPDQTICADIDSVKLRGTVTVSGGGRWTSSGSGTFWPDADKLDAVYLPSLNDRKAAVPLQIILTSTDNGSCIPVRDTMNITFVPLPVVNAGADIRICADRNSIPMDGKILNANQGIWSTLGTGSFAPDHLQLNALYVPSSADKSARLVKLVLKSGEGGCSVRRDTVLLTITPAPTVNAGADVTVCSNEKVILKGVSSVALGVEWSSSGSGSFTLDDELVTEYVPSESDRNAGTITFRITTTGNGTCLPVSDNKTVTLQTPPTVNAGADQSICKDNEGVYLSGTHSEAEGITWSSSGSGSFTPELTVNNAFYGVSDQDKQKDFIFIVATTIGNKFCGPAKDSLKVLLTPVPAITASITDICSGMSSIPLKGSITNAEGGIWTSSGNGFFTPDASDLQGFYKPSENDKRIGKVVFTLTSTGNGKCKAVSHIIEALIDPLPIADAGRDITVCRGAQARLAARVEPGYTYEWISKSNTTISTKDTAVVTVHSDSNFVLIVKDYKGCSTKDTIMVKVMNPPVLALAPYYCYTQSLIVDARPENLPVQTGLFQWYRNDSIIFTAQKTSISVEGPGSHMIAYNFDLCSTSDTTDIRTSPLLFGEDNYTCIGNMATIGTTKLPGGTYLWKYNGQTLSMKTSDTIKVLVSDDREYTVEVKDSYGCLNTDTINSFAVPPPDIRIENMVSCIGDTIALVAKPQNIDNILSQFSWKKEKEILNENSAALNVYSPGKYIVDFSLGDCRSRDSAIVIFNNPPKTDMPDLIKFCKEDDISVQLNAGPGSKFFWIDSGDSTKSIVVNNQGFYKVRVYNEFNCYSTDSIYVKETCPPKVFVPNAIRPAEPGDDQKLRIFGKGFTNYSLTIFNRWGEIIFFTNDRNLMWDGYYRGELMPIGVYNFLLRYEGEAEEYRGPYQIKGCVTIIK